MAPSGQQLRNEVGLPVPPDRKEHIGAFTRIFQLNADELLAHPRVNKLLQERVAKVSDADSATHLSEVASLLFSRTDGRDSLAVRREAAAERLNLTVQDFLKSTEPLIVTAVANELVNDEWSVAYVRRTRLRAWRSLLLAGLVALLLAAVLVSGWGVALGQDVERDIRIVSGGLLAVIGISWLTRSIIHAVRTAKLPEPSTVGLAGDYPDAQFLDECLHQAADRLNESRAAVVLMTDMVLNPSEYRARTVERVSLEGQCLRQRVSLELALNALQRALPAKSETGQTAEPSSSSNQQSANEAEPHASSALPPSSARPKFLYIPFIIPPKGMLIDQLEVMRRDESMLSTLSYEQSTRVLSLGLRFLLIKAIPKSVDRKNLPEHSVFNSAELKLLGIISRRGPVSIKDRTWQELKEQVDAELDHLNIIGPEDYYVTKQFYGCPHCRQRLTGRWRGMGGLSARSDRD